MRIATYVDADGNVTTFYQPGKIFLYEQISGIWTKIKKIPLDLNLEMSLPEVRVRLRAMVPQLDDCKVFLAGDVKGLPYAILEGMGFNIWKSSGSVLEQLDYVAQKEFEASEEAKKPKPMPLPVGDPRDCNYRINLAEVLNSDSNLTSKQILIPFLEKEYFNRLEIICEHPPRWMGSEMERLSLRAEAEAVGGNSHDMRILVYPKNKP
ncbi:MAG TPA: Fe-only nitrogenase accessory protein AnfO [Fibrobacteraceae bacterium]|nr:Fe-only nitrogenase accessory protein AnfO [Fibrobacteraceae bacterium]